MSGPKPKVPVAKLNPVIVEMLDTLAWSAIRLERRMQAGEITDEQAYELCKRAVAVMVEAAGAKLPKAGKGRPASLANVLRRLAVRRTLDRGSTVTEALNRFGGSDLLVVDRGEVVEVHGAGEVDLKHYYRDRKRFATEDAYMEVFEAALVRYSKEIPSA
jgi:hypothetical protein